MAKSPDQRYDSAEDLRSDLLRFIEGRPVLADQTTAIDAYGPSTAVVSATGTTATLAAVDRTEVVPRRRGTPATVGISGTTRRRVRKGPIALLIVLLVALAVVAAVLAATLAGGFDMPNIVGKTVADATTALEAKGLVVGSETPRHSTKAPGIVLSTDPPAGSTVKKGDRVNLVVSGALATVRVQDVVGDDLTGAEALLSSQNLRYKVTFVDSPGAQEVVLTQDPAANATIPIRTVVRLTVPRPISQVTISDVQGDTPAQAGSILQAEGLQVGGQTQQCSNNQQQGNVAGTQPVAGSKVARNSTVNLIVSSGACNVVVQGVVGDAEQAATNTLKGQNLTVASVPTQSCDPSQNGNVVDQSPSGGTQVTLPATVTITVCSSASPTSTSTSTSLPGP